MMDRLVNNVLVVPVVEGLCLFDHEAAMLLDHLPDYCVNELLPDMLLRVVSLYETVDDSFVPCEDYLFKFPGKWIHFRRRKDILLLAITTEDVNQVTFKMTTNLLLKNAPLAELRVSAKNHAATPRCRRPLHLHHEALPSRRCAARRARPWQRKRLPRRWSEKSALSEATPIRPLDAASIFITKPPSH